MNRKIAESAYLSGTTKYELWKASFDQRWEMPLREALVAALIKTLPPAAREELRALAPDAMKRLEDNYGR